MPVLLWLLLFSFKYYMKKDITTMKLYRWYYNQYILLSLLLSLSLIYLSLLQLFLYCITIVYFICLLLLSLLLCRLLENEPRLRDYMLLKCYTNPAFPFFWWHQFTKPILSFLLYTSRTQDINWEYTRHTKSFLDLTSRKSSARLMSVLYPFQFTRDQSKISFLVSLFLPL